MLNRFHYNRYAKVTILCFGYLIAVFFAVTFYDDVITALVQLGSLSVVLIVKLMILSTINWLMECKRWQLSLRYFKINQNLKQSSFQVLYAQPYAMVLGKLAGNTFGRLFHFVNKGLKSAVNAQVLSGLVQSSTLIFIVLLVYLLNNKIAFAYSLLFGLLLVILVCYWLMNKTLARIILLSALRYGCILVSYAVIVAGEFDLWALTLSICKTFFVLIFIPFSPLATLGSKEYIMHFFYNAPSLSTYIFMGAIVFLFNNLMPAIVGLVLTVFKKWN